MTGEAVGLGAIVLAGGKSTRMGCDKAFLPWGNRTLIEHIIDQLRPHFVDIMVVSASVEPYVPLGVRIVCDEKPGMGPLMGIVSGLKAARFDLNLIVACDIPRFEPKLFEVMKSCASHYDLIVPRHANGQLEPLLSVYHRRVVPQAMALIDRGVMKIDRLFPECHTHYLDLLQDDWLININTPQDYLACLQKNANGVDEG